MAGELMVRERVLSRPDEVWELTVRRPWVIGPMARAASRRECVGGGTGCAGVGRAFRQLHVLLRHRRQDQGVGLDLIPGRSNGGRGRDRLPDDVEAVIRGVVRREHLTLQNTVAMMQREIVRRCPTRELRPPSPGSVVHRIAKLEPVNPGAGERDRTLSDVRLRHSSCVRPTTRAVGGGSGRAPGSPPAPARSDGSPTSRSTRPSRRCCTPWRP